MRRRIMYQPGRFWADIYIFIFVIVVAAILKKWSVAKGKLWTVSAFVNPSAFLLGFLVILLDAPRRLVILAQSSFETRLIAFVGCVAIFLLGLIVHEFILNPFEAIKVNRLMRDRRKKGAFKTIT